MSASAFEDLEAAADNSADSSSSTSDTPKKQESQGDGTSKHRKHHNSESVNTNTVSEVEASNETSSSIDASDCYTGDTTYSNDNITINLSEYDQYNTKIYVADVTLSSAEYLKTAFANDTYGKNITATTSEMAEENSAILAINGDFYGVQESGYVIRNGIVYRSEGDGSEVLCIYANGTMEVINDSEYTAEDLVEKGVWQAFSFGPGLIENGAISVDTDDEVDMAMASNPRTAIGIIDTNHYVFVVSDGRTSESEGLSLYELAEFMQDLGVTTAYNLDGGGSSTMYFNGQIVNNPTSGRSIKERGVSDIVYIA
jgi:exopolysaccharide biosynthesis protein